MTKQELSKYAGTRFYNLSTRMGAKRGTIYCLTVYEVTERGTCRYISEVMGLIANKAQWEVMRNFTGNHYHDGRPTAKTLTKEFLDAVEK